MKKIYLPRDLENDPNRENPVVPGQLSVWGEHIPPPIPDELLLNWFRGIPCDQITPSDLTVSQDKRYAQPLLYFLARTIHAKNIVEIGVGDGSTTFPLLKAASESGGLLYSIDPSWAECTEELVRKSGGQEYWRFYKMESDIFFENDGKDLSIDFAFIDGDHSYDAVYNDAIHVFDRLVPGGIVIFDEFSPEGNLEDSGHLPRDRSPEACQSGTPRALMEVLPQYDVDTFPLFWGICGFDRFLEWTEAGMLMVRKRTKNEWRIPRKNV